MGLISVKGIGPYFAKQIIRYRERLGSFYKIEQLLEINKMTIERFKPLEGGIYVDKKDIKKINFKTDDKKILINHPYIGREVYNSIVLFIQEYVEKEMRECFENDSYFESLDFLNILLKNKVITEETFNKLKGYFE